MHVGDAGTEVFFGLEAFHFERLGPGAFRLLYQDHVSLAVAYRNSMVDVWFAASHRSADFRLGAGGGDQGQGYGGPVERVVHRSSPVHGTGQLPISDSIAFERELDKAVEEFRKGHARGSGGLGNKAVFGKAGEGVHFENCQAFWTEHEVGPREAAAVERSVCTDRQRLRFGGEFRPDFGWADFFGALGVVFRFVIEEMAFRDDFDHRERGEVAVSDHPNREFAAHDSLLDQQATVETEGFFDSRG